MQHLLILRKFTILFQIILNSEPSKASTRRCYRVVPCRRFQGEPPTMSGGLDVLQMKEEDVLKFLAAGTHLGGTNLDFQMEQYIYKRKSDGIYIINLKRTWEKLLLAARAIVAIENPADVSVISSRNTGQANITLDMRSLWHEIGRNKGI
ncbi:40S ribosomal protein SA [Alligator mississippiensis]|uniref:40S ribosomal protein SA n=1 Tax=Alligator mississippiensis TaxID=8496 RepID=A0A151P2K0_ALLMI|nr:40S ribosomal protein SA [Alligator mississippiensis]